MANKNLLPQLEKLIILTIILLKIQINVLACPQNCKCVFDDAVSCHYATLYQLPEDISSEVQQLDFSHNVFTTLPPSISNYPRLKNLIFTDNRIDSLGSNILINLDHLEQLDLSRNAFIHSKDLHKSSLNKLPALSKLNLAHNSLKTFPECGNTKLEHLNLENASISALNPGVLNYFPNLRTLNLALNNFAAIRGQFISRKLTVFNLTQCQIETVSSTSLDKLPRLTHLYLTKNYKLKSFNANSTSLIHLDLMDCNLESVPGSWLPNLTSLDLSKNHLRRLEAQNFENLPRMSFLNLADNSIDYIDSGSFKGLLYLEKVDLSHNTFNGLDRRIFNDNIMLKAINMSRTYISEMIPFYSRSLMILDLTNCEIREFAWNALLNMPKLQGLYLSGNVLKSIPANLTSKSLRILDLGNNRLSSLKNTTFSKTPLLQTVNLIGNRLVQLEFYPSFGGIRSIYLGDNPWRCECENKGFEVLFKTLSQLNSDVENARCQTPQHFEGKTWAEVCGPEWYPWNFAQGDKAWMVTVTLLAVMIFGCCLCVFVNRECNQRKKRLREEEAVRRSEVQERLMTMIQAARIHQEEESRNAPDPRELQGPPSYNEAITMVPLGSTASLYSNARKDDVEILGSMNSLNNLPLPANNQTTNSNNNLTNNNLNNSEGKQKVRRKKRPKSPHRLNANRMSAASQESSQVSDINFDANQSSSQMSQASQMTQSNPDLLDKSGKPLSARARRRRRRSQTRSQNMGESSSDELSVIETNM